MERCGNVEIGKVRHIPKVAEEVSSIKKISKKSRFSFFKKWQIVDKVCFDFKNKLFLPIFLKWVQFYEDKIFILCAQNCGGVFL